jgi:hypothetical protein
MALIRLSVLVASLVMLASSVIAGEESCAVAGSCFESLEFGTDRGLALMQMKAHARHMAPVDDDGDDGTLGVDAPSFTEFAADAVKFNAMLDQDASASEQLGSPQMSYAQGQSGLLSAAQQVADRRFPGRFAVLSSAANQDKASMEATIATLQTQLSRERTHEAQFKAKNEALHAELSESQDKEAQSEGEVTKLRQQIEEKENAGAFVQSRAFRVLQDVQAAQNKVRQTEEIVRSLLPRLQPNILNHVSAVASSPPSESLAIAGEPSLSEQYGTSAIQGM